MFICLGRYTRPLTDDDSELVDRHRAYLDELYSQQLLVASGPREPRTGGLIVARGSDQAVVSELLTHDPFVIAGLAVYELVQFHPSKGAHPDLIEA